MKALFTIGFLISFSLSFSQIQEQKQDHRNCGTPLKLEQLMSENVQYIVDMQKMEAEMSEWIKNNSTSNSKAVITIPVVVHVIYKTTPQNISVAQINSQIAILNADYRRTNVDKSNTPSVWNTIAADCQIEFCLAKRDPSGNPTTGITRTITTKSGFDIYTDEAKYTNKGGHDAWDRNKYLNIWVVPAILEGSQNTGILGYAQMPGSTAATDGVVVSNIYFGNVGTAQSPFNKGRTSTHEVGHWLSLYHIWGDDTDCWGSDLVNDTPNQEIENYGTPSFPTLDACATVSPGVMYMNYMDYTNDGAMNMFTTGQKNRMLATLNGSRASLKTSNGCLPVGIEENTNTSKLFIIPNPANEEISITFETQNYTNNATIQVFSSVGELLYSERIEATQLIYHKIDIRNLSNGVYFVKIDLGDKMEIKPFIKL